MPSNALRSNAVVMNFFSSARCVNLFPVAGAAAGSRPMYLRERERRGEKYLRHCALLLYLSIFIPYLSDVHIIHFQEKKKKLKFYSTFLFRPSKCLLLISKVAFPLIQPMAIRYIISEWTQFTIQSF